MGFDPEAVRALERSGWNLAASHYETTFATASGPFVAALLDAVAVRQGETILDLCCGTGVVASAAAARGATVRGLDFSANMLAIARERHPAIVFEQGDAEALPFADGAFEAVVSNFGIHHVPRPELALREARRVLCPGGCFAFTVWAAPARNIAWKLLFDAVARCGDPSASDAPAPGGGFGSADDCVAALRDAGFRDIRTETLERRWRHPDGDALVAALRYGTARMAAMIEAQAAASIPAIVEHVCAAAEAYRDGDGIAVPIAAILAAGIRD